MEKTLAMKLLEGKKIVYEVVTYPDTERDAVQVAQALGVSPSQVFKTLVVTRSSGRPLLVMLPADRQLDLKQLAKVLKEKKLKMATHAEAEALTGLQVGGISALALLNRPFTIYLDAAARDYDQVYISAGKRGVNLKMAVEDLVKATRAQWAE